MLGAMARFMFLILAATTALLPPPTAQGLRCVAILATHNDRTIAEEAAYYTAIIGAEAMDATGQSREAVRDMILQQVVAIRAAPAARQEIAQCTGRMKARVAIERATGG